MAPTVLITTAHGMFGGAVLRQLRSRRDLTLRAMVRRRRAGDQDVASLTWVEADLDDPPSLVAAARGVDAVFLCTPMDDRIAARECALIDAVRAHSPGAHVLILSGAVDHQGDALVTQHQQALTHLQRSGLAWTILSPNSVMETSLLPLAATVPWGVVMGCSGQGRVGLVALDDVARVAALLLTEGGHPGQELVVTGPQALAMAEVCRLLSAEVGHSVRYLDLPEASFQRMLLQDGGFGDAERIETEVLCHLRAWRRGGAAIVTDTVQRLTGREPQSVASWLQGQHARFARPRHLPDRLMGLLMSLQYGRHRLEAPS